MIVITQHIPNFIDTWPRVTDAVINMENLFKVDWIKKFSEQEGFHRFSISDDLMMAEYNEGKKWFVVGRFNNPNPIFIDLPDWEPKE